MLFAPYERYQYARAPLVEVICQLRFPTILSIGSQEPAAFQEAIRREFPRYAVRQEQPAPRVVGAGSPAPKLHRPVHPGLPLLGGLCPAPGQASGLLHPALSARFF